MAALVWNVQAHGVDAVLLTSNGVVDVVRGDRAMAFVPKSPPAAAPLLVLLPGGLVDPVAYVPLARSLADAGLPAAIVELPWRAAPTEGMREELWRRIEAAVDQWGNGRPFVLAGHSRGAALATRFAAERATDVRAPLTGLVLMGTTHPRDHNLSGAPFPVLKILASNDCVASADEARAHADRLPPDTAWLEIAGGNHRQFAYYGWQIGDCDATISREEQHRQVREALVAFTAAR